MVAAVTFDVFVTDMAAGNHAACLNADTDVLKVLLTNTVPSVTADTQLSELPAQCTGTGYTAGGDDVQNAATTATGTITVTGTDIQWDAGAADWTDFQYCTLYNSTADATIAYWDYGSTVSLGNGETFTFNIVTNLFTVAASDA